jgi:hypothetical protein
MVTDVKVPEGEISLSRCNDYIKTTTFAKAKVSNCATENENQKA